jgi:hypothetical protein
VREHRKEKDEQIDKEEGQSKSKNAFGGKVSKQPTACSRVLDRAIFANPLLTTVILSYLYFKPD